jgi:hypothetical protein
MNKDIIYQLTSNRITYSLIQEQDIIDIFNNISHKIVRNIGGVAPWSYTIVDAENFVKDSITKANNNLCYDYVLRLKENNIF